MNLICLARGGRGKMAAWGRESAGGATTLVNTQQHEDDLLTPRVARDRHCI